VTYKSRHVLLLAACLGAASLLPAQRRRAPELQQQFGFRFVGPQIGNRIASVAAIPGDPSTYYAGAASGGIWKSTDGGNRFIPIFDQEPVAAIGALAVAPSEASTIWAGTGEAWVIRQSDVMGNGVYKSTDAGKTWKHMGLDETGRIARIVIHPTNPDIVFVCALGRVTGPQQERGVFRTTDGGAHWSRVLFADENTGCSGLTMDPHNPHLLFAGMWQVVMHTYGEYSGGPGSGIYVSRDGGDSWQRIEGHGLPNPPMGKIDVAIAPTDANRVYALIQTANQGSLWRSDDGGENWRVVNHDRRLIGRAGYYIRIAVSPADENELFIANSSFFHSTDGGETIYEVPWGGDTHDIWIDPTNPDRFVITDDAGMNITTVHGRGFHRVQLPIGQMYHVAVDDRVPYWVYTNMQDDGTMRGPAISGPRAYGEPLDNWEHGLGGCESGFTLPDPTNPDIIWASCYGDEVTRYDAKTKQARSVSPWMHTLDAPANAVKYRCEWTPPLAIDPFDHNTVYYGCQVIFETSDGGQSWKVISPDLSTQDPSRLVSSGGISGDNLGNFYGEVVFAIAPSPIQRGLIWAGTNDGKVWYTKDRAHWVDVTKNISGMPPWGKVTKIEPSHFDPGTAYVAVDFHMMDNRDPYIYKTTDFGQTWTQIGTGLPKGPLAYVLAVAEDPNQKGLLFAGTGNGFYYSLDDGAHWTQLNTGLPHAPVSWIEVQKRFHDVVVSTYGRGIYILDDISPLEYRAAHPQQSDVVLYPSRLTYRLVKGGQAYITFELNQPGQAKLSILDTHNNTVRDFGTIAGKAGLNRVAWDLRYDPPQPARLRTSAPDNPFIWEEPRFRGQDWRPVTHWGIENALVGPIVTPGNYTIHLTVGGKTLTQPVEILRDPNVTSSDADLKASVDMLLRIRADINKVSGMINQIEWKRKQLEDLERTLESGGKHDLAQTVVQMNRQMEKVEYELIARENLNSDDKYFSEANKLYLGFIWLNGEVGTGAGDVAGGANYKPTAAETGVLSMLEKQLAAAESDYRNLMEHELAEFNRSLAQKGLVPVL
jgi:photosystem II stability/assembly factor-like uncharacterized protein